MGKALPFRLEKAKSDHDKPASISPAPIVMKVRSPLMKIWYGFVVTFLVTWVIVVWGLHLFPEVVRQWPIALIMIWGSLVAGSTPMGGGAIAFPFLVWWFGTPPDGARDFGLIIQSLGMTSAMIFIFCRRVVIQARMLIWTILGAAAGMLLGTAVIVPHVASNFLKLMFACTWLSFALLTIAKNQEFCSITGTQPIPWRTAMRTGLVVGIAGGIISSLIGVGVELLLYSVLILLYRCDLKIAVPTAVSAMAVTSVIGSLMHLWMGDISRDIATKFLAAAPLVIFGAPIGTYIVSVIPRVRTLYFISFLCVVQFGWTLLRLERTPGEWIFVVVAITLAGMGFFFMYRRGKQSAVSNQHSAT